MYTNQVLLQLLQVHHQDLQLSSTWHLLESRQAMLHDHRVPEDHL
jgi:hypothetical protein